MLEGTHGPSNKPNCATKGSEMNLPIFKLQSNRCAGVGPRGYYHIGKFISKFVGGMSLMTVLPLHTFAATGDMGTGIPGFGFYADASNSPSVIVWVLEQADVPFPTGCPYIRLTTATMGLESFKIAVAQLTMAKAAGRKVKFYAHVTRDGGCGIDYVQVL
jgi:hypothetical protein